MSCFSARNFVAAQDAEPAVRVKAVRGRCGEGSGDERGITLQTLIVMAVLVLMAVAGGVVIVAITDNSADDLEDQASDIDGRCQPWEIHDTELEAIGAGGGEEHFLGVHEISTREDPTDVRTGEGGVTSSKVGCLAPCYLQAKGDLSRETRYTSLDDIIADAEARLVFDTSNRPPTDPTPGTPQDGEYRLGVTYQRDEMNITDSFQGMTTDIPPVPTGPRYRWGNWFNITRALGTHVPPVEEGSKLAAKVTAGQDGCIIYKTDTDDICLDSRKPIGEQKSPC